MAPKPCSRDRLQSPLQLQQNLLHRRAGARKTPPCAQIQPHRAGRLALAFQLLWDQAWTGWGSQECQDSKAQSQAEH